MQGHHSILVSYFLKKKILFVFHGYVSYSVPVDDSPTLPVLRNFPVKNAFIDIVVNIGPDYEKFGTLLLEDKYGNEIKMIRTFERDDPLHIVSEILKQWLQGKGKTPVTWQTLVRCLRDTKLNVLADKIETSLLKHDGIEDSNRVSSEEL